MEKRSRGPYEATLIRQGIWAIDQDFVRSFLIEGKKKALLVDTCNEDADLSGFVAELTSLPVMLVHTHCDYDHIGASRQFSDIWMHPSDFSLLRATSKVPLAPKAIRETDRIDLGGRVLEVLLIPGHTPGSIALLERETKLLFSGDSVKSDTVFMFGPGRDLPAYIDSLTRLYEMRSAFDTVLPCHGEVQVSPELIKNLIEGAQRLLAGRLEGTDDGSGLPCKHYRYETAMFYY